MENRYQYSQIPLLAAIIIASLFCLLSCGKERTEEAVVMDVDMFLTEVSNHNAFEIAAGRTALTRGGRNAVRTYGQQMIDDHMANQEQLFALIASKGWDVPKEVLEKHQINLERLQRMSGTNFDVEFSATMISTHQEAIERLTMASDEQRGVPDQELREFALQKLRDIELHLAEAKDLDNKLRHY